MDFKILSAKPMTLDTYNANTKSWVDVPAEFLTTYELSLFQLLHGEVDDLAVVSLDGLEGNAAVKALSGKIADGYTLDCATGSRKFGQFLMSKTGYAQLYFPAISKRISHASILFSQLTQAWRVSDVRVVVLDDSDKATRIKYGIGDCHGLMSDEFSTAIASDRNAVQFRLCTDQNQIAKGTIVPTMKSMTFKRKKVDLILPSSSFKGIPMPVGEVVTIPSMVFGIQSLSRKRKTKVSHSVVGWFKSEESIAYLLSNIEREMAKLEALRSDIPALVEYLAIDDDGDDDEADETDASFKAFQNILLSDKYNQLLLHPKTCNWASKAFQRKLLSVAMGSSNIPCKSLMALPADVLPNNCVVSYCIPTGSYIFFRYPIRYEIDIDTVYVINPLDTKHPVSEEMQPVADKFNKFIESRGINYKGVGFVSPEYFANFGGDFDGDYLSLIPATAAPALFAEAQTFCHDEVIVKPPKGAIPGTIAEIAVQSASNLVGLISWMITCCRIHGMRDYLPELGQQLQLAVDSFKTGVELDHDLFKEVCGHIQTAFEADNVCWIRQYKKPNVFIYEPIVCNYDDTISICCNKVSELFEAMTFAPQPIWTYRFLFKDITPREKFVQYAIKCRKSYGESMREIWDGLIDENHSPLPGVSPVDIDNARNKSNALNKAFMDLANDKLRPSGNGMEWAAAFHIAFHAHGSNMASVSGVNPYRTCTVIFMMFQDEYKEQLATAPNYRFRLWAHQPMAPTDFNPKAFYNGLEVEVRCVAKNDMLYLVEHDTNKIIGKMITDGTTKDCCLPPVDAVFTVSLWSHKNKNTGRVSYHQASAVND